MTGLRWVVAVALMIGACATLPFAVVASWTEDAITSEDGFVRTLRPLVEDPAVRDLAARQIVDHTMVGVDRAPLPPVARDGIEQQVERMADRVVASDRFADTWERALREVHPELIAALRGDERSSLVTEGDSVRLRLTRLTAVVQEALTDAGIPGGSLVPEVEVTIPVATSGQLTVAGTAYRAVDGRGTPALLLTVLLAVAGVVIAPGRHRATLALGTAFGGLIALVITRVVAERAEAAAIRRIPEAGREVGAAALGRFGGSLDDRLMAGAGILAALGIVSFAAMACLMFLGRARSSPQP